MIRTDQTVVWASLVDSALGVVRLELIAESGDAAGPPPATPGPLSGLVRWVRRRLDKAEALAAEALSRHFEGLAAEHERVSLAENVGPLLRVRVEYAGMPSAARLSAWVEAASERVCAPRPG